MAAAEAEKAENAEKAKVGGGGFVGHPDFDPFWSRSKLMEFQCKG